jgi:DNA polymerase-3 subunit epsilon
LPALVLDAQATAADPARGALLELGWARWPEAAGRPEVAVHVVAPPPGAVMPRAVARLTGMRAGEWERGTAPAVVWSRLLEDARATAPFPVPVVVHFARFEEPYLQALHERHGAGPFPFQLLCTHAIARRLLPELPRRTLRALAGYFGAAVPALRRSAEHVLATAFVWRHLALGLEAEGVSMLDELGEWLARPPRRCARAYPLPRERRLRLPPGPGVYRLLRAGGAVVYVGKAARLRQRVSGHFQARGGERALEMLTQVRDVAVTETATALEAALLESDEIKQLAPPYNRALTSAGRSVWFATADLAHLCPSADECHPIGPLPTPLPFEALAALRDALVADTRVPLAVLARALGVAPEWAPPAECFEAGLRVFASVHGRLATVRDVLSAGARLWATRRAGDPPEPDAAPEEAPAARGRPRWDADEVREGLEETVRRAAHAVRRARWILRLCECTLAWRETDSGPRRLLSIERGAVAARADLAPAAEVPAPPGAGRSPADRRAALDVAALDRLRVLTTELRTLARVAPSVELRLGAHARLSRRRLEAVLRWV